MPDSDRQLGLDLERDLVCISDAAGYFTSLNRAWEGLLGWSRAELLGRPLIEFVHPEDVERTERETARVAQADYEVVGFENRYRHKDGSYRWLAWNARSDGEQFFGIAFDITERRHEEQRLRKMLGDERLLAYWQPIVDVRSRTIDRGELLVRMSDNGSVLAPASFLPAAERLGLIGLVDRWMLGRAAAASGNGPVLHINLSARTIEDDALVDELQRMVLAAECPDRLVFEITETAAIRNLEAAQAFTERLLPLGCKFALDDFGIGYGSLTYLRHLPVQILKIDRAFVGGLVDSPEDQALVRSVIALAHELGLETVAEGVEDEGTYEALRRLGVDYVQGYLIGRPEPARLNGSAEAPQRQAGEDRIRERERT